MDEEKTALKQIRAAIGVRGWHEVGFWNVFDLHSGEVGVKGIMKRAVESRPCEHCCWMHSGV